MRKMWFNLHYTEVLTCSVLQNYKIHPLSLFYHFFNIEVQIDNERQIHLRKPQKKPLKKPLTLHYYSHHTTSTKNATAESMYKTAEVVSSDPNNQLHSSKMVDALLLNNGYPNRVIEAIKDKRKRRRKRHKTPISSDNTAILKLSFINEATSRKF